MHLKTSSIRLILSSVLLLLFFAGCSKNNPKPKLVVLASANPHSEILKFVAENGILSGVNLEIKEYSGLIDANRSVVEGSVDANFFQHLPYLKGWQKKHNDTSLVSVADVHLEPIGMYSKTIKKLEDLPKGARLVLSKDSTNLVRGLYLLEAAGLVKLKHTFKEVDLTAVTLNDIVENPRNLQFSLVDTFMLARLIDEPNVSAVLINTANALAAGIDIDNLKIAQESVTDNPFVNNLVTLDKNKNDSRIQKLVAALLDKRTKEWINTRYSGKVVATP